MSIRVTQNWLPPKLRSRLKESAPLCVRQLYPREPLLLLSVRPAAMHLHPTRSKWIIPKDVMVERESRSVCHSHVERHKLRIEAFLHGVQRLPHQLGCQPELAITSQHR